MIVMTMVTAEVSAHYCVHPRAQWPTVMMIIIMINYLLMLCTDAFDRSNLTAMTGKKISEWQWPTSVWRV
jgi:hypothetical protein